MSIALLDGIENAVQIADRTLLPKDPIAKKMSLLPNMGLIAKHDENVFRVRK